MWNEGERDAGGQAGAREKKGLFFLFSFVSLVFLLALLWFLFYLLEPRVSAMGGGVLAGVGLAFKIAGAALVVLVGAEFASATLRTRLIPGATAGSWLAIVLLPVSEKIAAVFGISSDRVKSSFLEFNNALVEAKIGSRKPARVLLLLPHCLQNSDCVRMLGGDVRNCGDCGACVMSELKKLLPVFSVESLIVGGGALALRAVRELRPSAVVGVACERELVAAIKELKNIPVMAVSNCRPEGPCRNTVVEIDRVRGALGILLKRPKPQCSMH